MLKRAIFAATLACLALSASPASAHHSVNAQWDVKKELQVDGALVKLENVNPHTYWTFEVKEPSGTAEQWRFESVNPGALRRTGLKLKEDLEVGRTYTLYYNPARNGSKSGLLRGLKFGDRRVNFSTDYMPPK